MQLCLETGRLQQVAVCSEAASPDQRITELGSPQTFDCSLTFSQYLEHKQVLQFQAMICAGTHAMKRYISSCSQISGLGVQTLASGCPGLASLDARH